MATKFERTYSQIKSELSEIMSEYEYPNESVAFGHLVLKLLFDISDEDANESITDGSNDNGIDAIYFEEKEQKTIIHFFQFKFPATEASIGNSVSQNEILKLFNGFEHFIGRDETYNSLSWNDLLKEKRLQLKSLEETDNNVLHIVRYTSSEMTDNIGVLDSKVNMFIDSSGNNVSTSNLFAKEICDLYENANLNTWPDFSFVYKKDMPPFEDSNAKVYSYYISAYNLYQSLKDLKSIIFEGNVRYFDDSSKVNSGIIDTLEGDDCSRLHLLNNGITIVCSNCSPNSANDTANIKKGSIINGAQTVGCIFKTIDKFLKLNQDIERFKNSYLFIKVIQIQNKQELVDRLVFTLNTQNQMRSSYSLSNDQQIKSIQREINASTKYFLQIKNNEYNHQKSTNTSFSKLKRNVIDIETAIQAFVAFEDIPKLSYISKNSKAQLFTENNRRIIIEEITKKKLLESYEALQIVTKIASLYRSFRKDSTKNSILNILSIGSEEIDRYRFINTGNYLILFALGIYCRKHNIVPNQKEAVVVINELAPLFVGIQIVSNATRSKEMFDKVRLVVENDEKIL